MCNGCEGAVLCFCPCMVFANIYFITNLYKCYATANRYIFFTVYQFFNRTPVFLRSTINIYNICKSVKIYNNAYKNSSFQVKIFKIKLKICHIMLKIRQIVLKICKSTSFLPKFSQCTSIFTAPPPPYIKCEVYIPVM